MELSARNMLKGTVTDIKKGAIMAKVVIAIGSGLQVVSVVTVESVEELKLKVGDEAYAVIKSTEVLLAKP
ncbi:MAG: TOBE domain-containing protein [Tannerella sp.]|nr:TOBE domain-containing protein [Tannerella sp.]